MINKTGVMHFCARYSKEVYSPKVSCPHKNISEKSAATPLLSDLKTFKKLQFGGDAADSVNVPLELADLCTVFCVIKWDHLPSTT